MAKPQAMIVSDRGVRVGWTIDDCIEVRDGATNMLLLRCVFKEHWYALTRDQKQRLIVALMRMLPGSDRSDAP